jgi:hypothetical protein
MIKPEHVKTTVEDCANIPRNRPLSQQIGDETFEASLPTCVHALLASEPSLQTIQTLRQEIYLVCQRRQWCFFKRLTRMKERGSRQHGIAKAQFFIHLWHLSQCGERRLQRIMANRIAGI